MLLRRLLGPEVSVHRYLFESNFDTHHLPLSHFLSPSVSALNDKFGTSDDLHSLITAIHSRNMYIMIDVVINNVAASAATYTPDYSPYFFTTSEYYHPYATINYSNLTSEQVG